MERFLPLLAGCVLLLLAVAFLGRGGSMAGPSADAKAGPSVDAAERMVTMDAGLGAQGEPVRRAQREVARSPAAAVSVDGPSIEGVEENVLCVHVHPPSGEPTSRNFRLVLEKDRELERRLNRPNIPSEMFVSDSRLMSAWETVDEASGKFGDEVVLRRPEGIRTRLRLEAPCAIHPPIESTELDSTGAPVELFPSIAGIVRLRLVTRDPAAVHREAMDGVPFPYAVSPRTGYRSEEGSGGLPTAYFDWSLSAVVPGVAPRARITPGTSRLVALDGTAFRVRWPGATLGELPHKDVEVEVERLYPTKFRVFDAATGLRIARCGVAFVDAEEGDTIRATGNSYGVAFIESPRGLFGTARATADGYLPAEVTLRGPAEPVEIRLQPAPLCRGRVLDLAGASVPGVQLRVSTETNATVTTDAVGEFTFRRPSRTRLGIQLLAAGEVFRDRLRVEEQHREALLLPATFVSADEVLPLTIATTFRVSGRVLDPEDEPQDGLEVLASRPQKQSQANHIRVSGTKEHFRAALREGGFLFKELPPGEWQFTIVDDDGACLQPIQTIVGDTVLDLVITEGGPSLAGRVLGPTGLPRSAMLRLQGPTGMRFCRSKPDGQYLFGRLEPGDYHLIAQGLSGMLGHSSEAAGASMAVTVHGDAQVQDVRLVHAVPVICHYAGGEPKVAAAYRVAMTDEVTGIELQVEHVHRTRPAHFRAPAGHAVRLEVQNFHGDVLREIRRTFQLGEKPFVDVGPR